MSRISVNSVEQLSTLKALRMLDQFTLSELAVVSGVRPSTLRPLLLRWRRTRGRALLKEVGVRSASGRGQPPKLYVLNPEMIDEVESLIGRADSGLSAALLRPNPAPAAELDRMSL